MCCGDAGWINGTEAQWKKVLGQLEELDLDCRRRRCFLSLSTLRVQKYLSRACYNENSSSRSTSTVKDESAPGYERASRRRGINVLFFDDLCPRQLPDP